MDLIKQLNSDTKALVLVNEYLRYHRDFPSLTTFLDAMMRDRAECAQIMQSIQQQMASAGWQPQDIDYLVQGLRQALAVRTREVEQTRVNRLVPGAMLPSPSGPQVVAPAPSGITRTAPLPSDAGPEVVGEQHASALARAQAKGRGGTMIFQGGTAAPKAAPKAAPIQRQNLADAAQGSQPEPPQAPAPGGRHQDSGRQTMQFGASAKANIHIEKKKRDIRHIVLVAEDDSRARVIYQKKLEDNGFEPLEVSNGDDAWKQIEQGGLYAVILDIKMPGMDGLEILSRMRRKDMNIPVVICTSYSHIEDEFAIRTYPRLKFLVKPCPPDQIIEAIRELVAMPA